MGWLEKLKAIFNIEINKPLINIDFSREIRIETPDTAWKIEETKDGATLLINPDKLTPQQKESLRQIAKELPVGKRILKRETNDLLNKIYEYNKNDEEDRKILDFFRGVISEEDLEALDASLILRRAFENYEGVDSLKDDIREKFGSRGSRISDLCTAHYFEEFFMPLFNYSEEEFKKIYEQTINNRILVTFVHGHMDKEEVKNDIKNKITTSRRYGLKVVHLHGIGRKNVGTINAFLKENEEFFKTMNVVYKKTIDKKDLIAIEFLL